MIDGKNSRYSMEFNAFINWTTKANEWLMTKGPESTCQSLVWKNGPRAFNDEHSLSTQGGTCLYDILGITKKATNTEIRKAYRRLALAYHPDRNKEADAAKKFRRVQYAQKVIMRRLLKPFMILMCTWICVLMRFQALSSKKLFLYTNRLYWGLLL